MPATSALFETALARHQAGDVAAAEALYRAVLRDDARHVLAGNNLAVILKNAERTDEALALLGMVLTAKPDFTFGYYNLALLHEKRREANGAAANYLKALALDPDYPDALKNLGALYIRAGKPEEALPPLERAVARASDDADARFNLAVALRLTHRLRDAAAQLRVAVALAPGHLKAWLELGFICLQIGDWAEGAAVRRRLDDMSAATGFAGSPLDALSNIHYLAVLGGASPAAARAAAAEIARQQGGPARRPDAAPGSRLRLGYLSANFGNQAIGHVSRRLYAAHDRDRFAVHLYALADRSREDEPYWRDISGGAEIVRLVHDREPEAIVEQIRADGIDILVYLDGHMSAFGLRVMALRPAPVQVSWLGVAGSPGLPCHDYVVADPVVVRDGEHGRYPEAVARLPVYHCADRHEIADAAPSRRAEGLPEDAVVLCAFNNTQKIDETIFACWMQILAAVPDSVLWLSNGDSPDVVDGLQRAAAQRGIAAARLVFARLEPDKARHLRRHDLADLFVDTLTLTASTTALDALWAGLPLVTCPGATWPSRIAASFLAALGLDEFVAADLDAYRAMIVGLCRDPAVRRAARAKLDAAKRSRMLFDIAGFTRNLEAAYLAMWARHRAGEAPRGFDVAPAPLRLHIGGRQAKPGWRILNIAPGPEVDVVGSCVDLSRFADASVDEIYASHVYEHLGFRHELPAALAEACRVLKPGGLLRVSVPDLETLAALFVDPQVPRDQKFSLMAHMFGAQEDAHDVHRIGLTFDFLGHFLRAAGFAAIRRVDEFGLFDDYSSFRRFGMLISLNVEAVK